MEASSAYVAALALPPWVVWVVEDPHLRLEPLPNHTGMQLLKVTGRERIWA